MKLPSLTLIDIPLRADKTRTNYHLYFTQHADFESHRWVFSVYHFIILDFVRVGIHYEFRSSSADQVNPKARNLFFVVRKSHYGKTYFGASEII